METIKLILELTTTRKCLKNLLKKPNHVSRIAYEEKITYPYLSKIIKELTETGFVESEKNGRKKIIKLTEKGKKVILKLIELENLINGK